MAASLRAPFRIATLSHCSDFLRITWQDGAKSAFPNVWLRGCVRDPTYFDQYSWTYPQHDYARFVATESQIVGAENRDGSEDVDVKWNDHRSIFNSSWLRAQDMKINAHLLKKWEIINWDASAKFPIYQYSERKEKFETWFTDLVTYGVAFFEGVPPSHEGLEGILHCVGQPKQRRHPINTIVIAPDKTKTEKIDQDAYGAAKHPIHIDTAYYDAINTLSCIMATYYSAPVQDTYNYWIDSVAVIKELRREEPEAYHLLSTIPVRFARRRLTTRDEVEPGMEYIYHNEIHNEKPIICSDPREKRHPSVLISNKHGGMELSKFKDNATMKRLYEAYVLLLSKLDDPKNHQRFLLNPGRAVIFNNHRVTHGRDVTHPETERNVRVGFLGADMWSTRWRMLLGEKSGLANEWLYGCTDEQLEVLSSRLDNSETVQKPIKAMQSA